MTSSSTSEAFFEASAIEVRGSDWSARVPGDKVSFSSLKTDRGPRFDLTFDTNTSHKVLIYWETPEDYWVSNQTFRWKLTDSWVSAPNKIEPNGQATPDWSYWNTDKSIDSEIQIPQFYSGFQCDYLEFTYTKDMHKTTLRSQSDATLVVRNFQFGFLPEANIYNPCPKNQRCRVIEGNITCGNSLYWQYGLLALVALSCMLCGILQQCDQLRSRQTSSYQQVDADEDDVDDFHNELVEDLKRQGLVSIEMTGQSLIPPPASE